MVAPLVPTLVESLSLFFAGLLAGEEFVIRYGVRVPLAALADRAHIEFRQSLILRLRVLVPSLFFAAILSAGAALGAQGFGPGAWLRCAGLGALLAFITVTLLGTVPINQRALTWQPDAPPADWKDAVRRWEQLDLYRCWAAVAAFACFLSAAALRLRAG